MPRHIKSSLFRRSTTTATSTPEIKPDSPKNEAALKTEHTNDSDTITAELPAKQKHSMLARYWSHKLWTVPLTLLVLLALLFAVPYSRYTLLALFIKESITITVDDSTTHTPISGAKVYIHAGISVTNARGIAHFKVPVGTSMITITKQYYKLYSGHLFVPTMSHNAYALQLIATGRQVPVVILNKITGKPVANANIAILDTEAKTDQSGKAIIVLPVSAAAQSGTITANGFTSSQIKVIVTGQAVPSNTFMLTPSGTVYFLSNLSGKIDVIKTNLDGTNRKTVLAGTGNESPTSTVLLASRDWKYLALLTQRTATGNPELDLIDTSTDTMTNIDEGDATFSLVGWAGDRFIYLVNRTNVSDWQNGQEVLKSFNAATKSITVLAQTIATGNSEYAYIKQNLENIYIINDQVVYTSTWAASDTYELSASSNPVTLNTVSPDGSGSSVVKNFSQLSTQEPSYSINAIAYDEPNSIALQYLVNGNASYFEFQSGQVTQSNDLTDQAFYQDSYPTYLESPSGNQTFWSVPTDGKYTLFVGDKSGNHSMKVAELSDYSPYGWYTDQYLLVSKNSSELYIMPVSGGTPLPVTDYFKPSQFYNNGYGGGYGGL